MLADMKNREDLTGEAIRRLRDQLGESQQAFAKRFDLDQSTISDWENHGPPSTGPARVMLRQLLAKHAPTDAG